MNQLSIKYLMQLALLCLIFGSCGPNKSQLRTELQGVEREMMDLQAAAYQHQSAMNQADFDSFVGGFATGFGAVGGDYQLAGQGVSQVVDAANRSDVAAYTIDQIQQRYKVLAKRRMEIVKALQ